MLRFIGTIILSISALCALMVGLYEAGLLVLNVKRALLFVGSLRGKGRCRAQFTACHGRIQRVIRFRESRTYRFELKAPLRMGEMEAELLGAGGRSLMRLCAPRDSAQIDVRQGERYVLRFIFRQASGEFELSWDA